MSTDNPKISAYVPQALYDRFKQFQDEQSLSMSQAVIVLFAEYFGLEQVIKNVSDEVIIGNITLPRIEKIEQQLSQILLDVEELKTTKQTTGSLPSKILQPNLFNNIHEGVYLKLTLHDLMKRLQVSNVQAITNRVRNSQKFIEWSKSEDPDNIAWEFLGKNKGSKYSPVEGTSSELLGKLRVWVSNNT